MVLEGLEEALLTTLTLQLASFPLYVLTVTHAVPVFTALNCPLQLVFVIETIFLLLVRNVRFEEAESDESIEFKEPVCPTLRVKLDLLSLTDEGAFLTFILQLASLPL